MVSPSVKVRMWSWQVVVALSGPWATPLMTSGAHAADALPAVVVEGDRVTALCDDALVDDIEHFQEGGAGRDARSGDLLEVALVSLAILAPDLEREVEKCGLSVDADHGFG